MKELEKNSVYQVSRNILVYIYMNMMYVYVI